MYMVDGELRLRDLFPFRLLQSVRHYSPEPIQNLSENSNDKKVELTKKRKAARRKGERKRAAAYRDLRLRPL
jgi:hypothetical protein